MVLRLTCWPSLTTLHCTVSWRSWHSLDGALSALSLGGCSCCHAALSEVSDSLSRISLTGAEQQRLAVRSYCTHTFSCWTWQCVCKCFMGPGSQLPSELRWDGLTGGVKLPASQALQLRCAVLSIASRNIQACPKPSVLQDSKTMRTAPVWGEMQTSLANAHEVGKRTPHAWISLLMQMND